MEIKGGKRGRDKALLTTQGKQVDGELPTAEDQTKSCERPSHAHLLRVQNREPPPLPVPFTPSRAGFGWIELCSTSLDNGGSTIVNDCTESSLNSLLINFLFFNRGRYVILCENIRKK